MSSQTHEQWVPEWTFGDRVRKIRRSKGLSQSDLARDLGVKTPSVAGWESGANSPRNIVAVAQRIELAYGVPASWVLGLETQNPRPDGPDGGLASVRHQGLEPRTRWFEANAADLHLLDERDAA